MDLHTAESTIQNLLSIYHQLQSKILLTYQLESIDIPYISCNPSSNTNTHTTPSLESFQCKLMTLKKVVNKLQKRLLEKDPVNGQPRYGKNTQKRVERVCELYHVLEGALEQYTKTYKADILSLHDHNNKSQINDSSLPHNYTKNNFINHLTNLKPFHDVQSSNLLKNPHYDFNDHLPNFAQIPYNPRDHHVPMGDQMGPSHPIFQRKFPDKEILKDFDHNLNKQNLKPRHDIVLPTDGRMKGYSSWRASGNLSTARHNNGMD